jgi:hypothetical protein
MDKAKKFDKKNVEEIFRLLPIWEQSVLIKLINHLKMLVFHFYLLICYYFFFRLETVFKSDYAVRFVPMLFEIKKDKTETQKIKIYSDFLQTLITANPQLKYSSPSF